MDDICVSVIVF